MSSIVCARSCVVNIDIHTRARPRARHVMCAIISVVPMVLFIVKTASSKTPAPCDDVRHPFIRLSFVHILTWSLASPPVRVPQSLAVRRRHHHHQPPCALVGSQSRATLGIARTRCSTKSQTFQSPASPRRDTTRSATPLWRTRCNTTENSYSSRRGTWRGNHRSASFAQPSPNGTPRSTRRRRNRPHRQSTRTSFASSAPAPRAQNLP